MPELDKILTAINLADHEGIKKVVISIDDLLLLRATIKELIAKIKSQNMENSMLTCKLAHKTTSFDVYKQMSLEKF